MGCVVDWSTTQGATSILSGQTAYAPKIELGHALVPLINYCAHHNPIIHWIYEKVAKTINWDTLYGDLALYLQAYQSIDQKFELLLSGDKADIS